MMSDKHTPGPWIAEQRDTHSAVTAGKGLCPVAHCPQWSSRDDRPKAAESFANARLIAAVPDLLEAAENVKALGFDDEDASGWGVIHITREDWDCLLSAIAKARGDQPC